MPETGRIAPIDITPIDIAFLVFDGFQPIDLAGPWQAFVTANEESGQQRYRLVTCGSADVAATTGPGLRLQVDLGLAESLARDFHTVIVPGGEGVHRLAARPDIRDWLRAADATTRRTCSVCTGAFLLAEAGLLDGRRVTTHWRAAEQLQQRFPALQVCGELIYSESGKYWTSAGVTAGIDLALTLIERDGGRHLAQRVARRLVVPLRRDGDQRQYSQALRAQDRAGAPFSELVGRLMAAPSRRWTIDEMAELCHMSRRTFQRRFKASFGLPPLVALRQLRDETVR
ncbi:AraC family transcriptional regulator [Mitsuaria sp. GD03876]|uniref:GlxA family transcriptional regulator n=1 Tax=Mitsuaria sp. GD03876 TaxID=2975399 RepID=UPI002446C34B|nr:AraC family transcriptional regulator [Mitsuaria sp. GD03876]MDH0865848.1 AraC family transcriptional regulator [Mitsuaria sp. GD03876]